MDGWHKGAFSKSLLTFFSIRREITPAYLFISQVCLALGDVTSIASTAGSPSCALTYLPRYFVSFRIMFKGNWEVSSFIKFSKCCRLGWSFFKCSCSWWASHLQKKKKKNRNLVLKHWKMCTERTLVFFKVSFCAKCSGRHTKLS